MWGRSLGSGVPTASTSTPQTQAEAIPSPTERRLAAGGPGKCFSVTLARETTRKRGARSAQLHCGARAGDAAPLPGSGSLATWELVSATDCVIGLPEERSVEIILNHYSKLAVSLGDYSCALVS